MYGLKTFCFTICFFIPELPFINLFDSVPFFFLSRLRDISHARLGIVRTRSTERKREREREGKNYYTFLVALKLYYKCMATRFFPPSNFFIHLENTRANDRSVSPFCVTFSSSLKSLSLLLLFSLLLAETNRTWSNILFFFFFFFFFINARLKTVARCSSFETGQKLVKFLWLLTDGVFINARRYSPVKHR